MSGTVLGSGDAAESNIASLASQRFQLEEQLRQRTRHWPCSVRSVMMGKVQRRFLCPDSGRGSLLAPGVVQAETQSLEQTVGAIKGTWLHPWNCKHSIGMECWVWKRCWRSKVGEVKSDHDVYYKWVLRRVSGHFVGRCVALRDRG